MLEYLRLIFLHFGTVFTIGFARESEATIAFNSEKDFNERHAAMIGCEMWTAYFGGTHFPRVLFR